MFDANASYLPKGTEFFYIAALKAQMENEK